MFKNGNDVSNDCNAEVHHDVFAEVHQHVLVNSAVTRMIRQYCRYFGSLVLDKRKNRLALINSKPSRANAHTRLSPEKKNAKKTALLWSMTIYCFSAQLGSDVIVQRKLMIQHNSVALVYYSKPDEGAVFGYLLSTKETA